MTETTSSVGQLCNILKKIKKIEFINTPRTSKQKWSYILSSDDDSRQVPDQLAELFGLLHIARQDMIQLGTPYSDIGTSTISKLQYIIIDNELESPEKLAQKINEEILAILKLCDVQLKEKGNSQKIIAKHKQKELLEKVNSLIKEFYDSELPKDFKLELITELTKIQNALINFNITGEACLQQVCKEVIGDIIIKASQKPKLFKNFQQSVQKLLNITILIGGVMTTYDLSLKYQSILVNQITNLIENLLDEANASAQRQLEGTSEPKEMYAKIEDELNHKCAFLKPLLYED